MAGNGAKIQEIVREIMYLPGTKGVLPALTEMRNQRQHLAIVLDEYGGTDGIITMEDLVECLIGEIHDEYDEVLKDIEHSTDGSSIVNARVPIWSDVPSTLHLPITLHHGV